MYIKILLILFFVFSGLFLFSQEEEIPSQDIDPDGYNIFYYSDGSVSSEGYLVDGKPEGFWRSYYPDGTLKSEGNRRLFVLDSIWNFYYPDGNLKKSIYYRNDKRNGYTITYDYYDDEDSVKNYHKSSKVLYLNGTREGQAFYYDRNSVLKYSYHYRNGKRHGVGKEYNQDSIVITLFNYYDSYLIDRTLINRFDNSGQKSGKWISFYDNGNKHIETHYLNGKLHGDYIEYDRHGDILTRKTYVNGEIYVPYPDEIEEEIELVAEIKTSYYQNGRIRFQGAFLDTIPVGIHREFDEEGIVKSSKEYNTRGQLTGIGFYDENGLRTGNWQLFGPIDNYVYAEGSYRDGLKHGFWTYYYPDKSIEQKGTYIAGKPEDEWIWYHQNGNIRKKENYLNGKLEGEYVEYDIAGNILIKGEYFDDAREGEWYYKVGNITKKGSYKLDEKNGEWKHIYNDTGSISFEGNFVNGDPDGVHKFYYSNGKIRILANYRMGSKHDSWRKYNDDGTLFITQTYENDRLVRVDGRRVNIDYE